MGDHGYRDQQIKSPTHENEFMNLLAIHMPASSGTKLQPVKTLVNLFPTVLNAGFGTKIPYKPDSSVFIKIRKNQ
jgi:hypothetical protein